MGIVEEESDESIQWMELLVDANLVAPELMANLINEGNELLTVVVASIKTARR